jgi:hypothetical protein
MTIRTHNKQQYNINSHTKNRLNTSNSFCQIFLELFPQTEEDRKEAEGFKNYIHTSQMHNTRSLVGRGVARTEHPHPGGVALTRQNFP